MKCTLSPTLTATCPCLILIEVVITLTLGNLSRWEDLPAICASRVFLTSQAGTDPKLPVAGAGFFFNSGRGRMVPKAHTPWHG